MDKIINVALLKQPLNWVIVVLMLLLFFLGAEIVFNQFAANNS